MPAPTLDGIPGHLLARRWGVPQAFVHGAVSSTMDLAHELGAAGAPHGTTVIAFEQTAGRGRDGRAWRSPPGGAWLSMLLRSTRAEFATLSLRVGLVVADAVDELLLAPRARLKWPNDVLVDDRKVAGVLCEGRWQGSALQWLAIGVGVNVCNAIPAELAGRAVALEELLPSVRRLDVLDRVVPAIRTVVAGGPRLVEAECQAFAERDWLAGRVLRAPIAGRACGIRPDGALLVERNGDGVTSVVLDGRIELA